jgi:hypothetical protein
VHVPACQECEHGGTHGPEIRALVYFAPAAPSLLWRHVRWRAKRHPTPSGRNTPKRHLAHLRDPKVEYLDGAIVRQKEILGFQITVHDSLPVRGDEGLQYLIRKRQDLERRQATTAARRANVERFAIEQLHYVESRAVFADVVIIDRQRSAMTDAVRNVSFPQEARADVLIEGQMGVQNLHRNNLTVAVNTGINRGHSADTKQTLERPLALERLTDALFRTPSKVTVQHRHQRAIAARASLR